MSISAAIHIPGGTFIHREIWPGKNSMELFFNAKFYFKSTWNHDWVTSHYKHLACESPAVDTEKSTNFWSGAVTEQNVYLRP